MLNRLPLYVNRDIKNSPWGGGALFVNNFIDYYRKSKIDFTPPESTVIFVVGLDSEDKNRSAEELVELKLKVESESITPVPMIIRVNDNDARKGTNTVDKRLLKLSRVVDGAIFVSEWQKDYFMSIGWGCKNSVVIQNGVDSNIFCPDPNKQKSNTTRVVTHHWSNNHMKGFDFYEMLDKNVSIDYNFKYVGRDRGTFSNTRVIRPLMGPLLAKELSSCDVYVSASRNDPGPNHILEALSCGLPTYVHVDGGGCVEFAGADHAFSSLEQLLEMIKSPTPNTNCVRLRKWDECSVETYEFILSVAKNAWKGLI